jgi:hypothetical protein
LTPVKCGYDGYYENITRIRDFQSQFRHNVTKQEPAANLPLLHFGVDGGHDGVFLVRLPLELLRQRANLGPTATTP